VKDFESGTKVVEYCAVQSLPLLVSTSKCTLYCTVTVSARSPTRQCAKQYGAHVPGPGQCSVGGSLPKHVPWMVRQHQVPQALQVPACQWRRVLYSVRIHRAVAEIAAPRSPFPSYAFSRVSDLESLPLARGDSVMGFPMIVPPLPDTYRSPNL
jgi:hypothetical protein